MLGLVTMAQSVTPEQVMAQGGTPMFVIALIISAIITGAFVGFILTLVDKLVVGHKIRFGSAFAATFLVVLVQGAIAYALAQTGIIDTQSIGVESDTIAYLMPLGPLVFGALQLIGFVLMILAARMFLHGPSDERPSWLSCVVVAVFTLFVLFVFNVALAQLGGYAG